MSRFCVVRILKSGILVWITKYRFLYFMDSFEFWFSNTLFPLRWLWYLFYCLVLGKMAGNQDRLRYYRVIQHVSLSKEKARLSRLAVRESSFTVERPPSQDLVSLPHYKAPKALIHVVYPMLNLLMLCLNIFLKCPLNLSLLPQYVHHSARHVWMGEVINNWIVCVKYLC